MSLDANNQEQHTVSRFYLKGFAQESGDRILWRYGKDGTGPNRISPRDATTESHFYSVKRADGTWDISIEQKLCEIETETAPALRRLAIRETLRKGDREKIAYFVALLFFRVSAVAEHSRRDAARMQTVEGTTKFVEADRDHLERLVSKEEIDAFIEEVQERGFGVTPHEKQHLLLLGSSARKATRNLLLMQWHVCRPPQGGFFITSDNPAFARRPHSLLDPYAVGIQRDDLGVEIGFPLSRSAYLLASWKAMPARHAGAVSAQRVRELNRRTVLSATEYVFSPKRCPDIATLVAEHNTFKLKHPMLLDQVDSHLKKLTRLAGRGRGKRSQQR